MIAVKEVGTSPLVCKLCFAIAVVDGIYTQAVVAVSMLAQFRGAWSEAIRYSQNLCCRLPPTLPNLYTIGEIAQIAQHTSSILRTIFTTFVALVGGVWADEFEYSLQDLGWKPADAVSGGRADQAS